MGRGNSRTALGGPQFHHELSQPVGVVMGKYFIAWLLGVPVFVLALFYFFF